MSLYAGEEPSEPRAPDTVLRDSDYEMACASCYAEWDGSVECPSCGTLTVDRGSRVQLTDATGTHTGTVTALVATPDDRFVVVKWDSGITERCLPDELREEEA